MRSKDYFQRSVARALLQGPAEGQGRRPAELLAASYQLLAPCAGSAQLLQRTESRAATDVLQRAEGLDYDLVRLRLRLRLRFRVRVRVRIRVKARVRVGLGSGSGLG